MKYFRLSSSTGFPCSPRHSHGSTWKRGVCESCICENGKTLCYTEHCDLPDCEHPVLAKGQCCALCINHPDDKRCRVGNATFALDESWVSDDCEICRCHEDGLSVCSRMDCETVCGSVNKRPPHCCPRCQGRSYLNNL